MPVEPKGHHISCTFFVWIPLVRAFPCVLYEFLMTGMSSYIHPGRMQFQQKQSQDPKEAGPGKPVSRHFAECVRSTGNALLLEDRYFENHLFFERIARSSSLLHRIGSSTTCDGSSSALTYTNLSSSTRTRGTGSAATVGMERWSDGLFRFD